MVEIVVTKDPYCGYDIAITGLDCQLGSAMMIHSYEEPILEGTMLLHNELDNGTLCCQTDVGTGATLYRDY